MEVVNWHGNLKQAPVVAQHKLVLYGDGSFYVFTCLRCSLYEIIVILLNEYHSAIAKSCTCFVNILNASK
jgi:hypothetical protein